MSIPRHTPTEREDAWSNVDECLRDFDHLTHGLPLGDMLDYARKNGFGPKVIDGLDKLAVAAGVLVNDGPDVIRDFATAAGMTDELVAREQQGQDRRLAAHEDPNGLFQMMKRKAPGE